jgi:hypothetical protein
VQPILEAIRAADPILLNSLTFLVGIVAGHRIALVRDKRQEFNAAVAPLRAELIKSIETGGHWMHVPSSIELDRFEHLLWPWTRRRLRRAIASYRHGSKERENYDPETGISEVDTAYNIAAARLLLPFFKPR